MGLRRCPGSLAFTQPKIEIVRCPHCGGDAEIWSDEVEGVCPVCREKFMRTHKPSCADWCKYARECLGDETYKKYQNAKSTVRKEALLGAVEDRFQWDDKRKRRARAILRYADAILKKQPDADPNVVVAAGVLSVQAAESASTGNSEESGPVAYRAVLDGLGYPNGFIKQVCEIISGDPSKESGNLNAIIVHDAVILADRLQGASADAGDAALVPAMLTEEGRSIAQNGLPPSQVALGR